MDLKAFVPHAKTNAATMLLSVALHYAMDGKIDTKTLDVQAVGAALFSLVDQIEAESPGLAETYGWSKAPPAL